VQNVITPTSCIQVQSLWISVSTEKFYHIPPLDFWTKLHPANKLTKQNCTLTFYPLQVLSVYYDRNWLIKSTPAWRSQWFLYLHNLMSNCCRNLPIHVG
jgi:hypothetical protein